jgi:outer membrane protein assembly factor BamD
VHPPQSMTRSKHVRPLTLSAAVLGGAVFVLSGCGGANDATKLTRELLTMPKEEAYARGEGLVKKKKYETGRQYLRFVSENYANDPIGRQAALRLADSFFDEKTQLGYLEAGVRYKDFRNRYPSHPKSDYALFRLGQCSDRQAERPDREQTNTRLAATSYRELIINFPDSPYSTESRARLGVMRNLLAEHEYLVGHFYLKRKAWRASRGRMEVILAAYPEYTGLDKVLFEAGILEGKMGNGDQARSYWERLQKEYPASPLAKKVPALPAAAPPVVRAAGR